MLDLGGFVSFSLYNIGSTLTDAINEGRLRLISTNLEANFNIEDLLQEAERRLQIFGNQYDWIKLRKLLFNTKEYYTNERFSSLVWSNKPILNPAELEFVSRHQGLVQHVGGIDTAHLPTFIQGEHIDLLHESLGGMSWYSDLDVATNAVVASMKPDGVIMTTTTLEANKLEGSGYRKTPYFEYDIWVK